MFDINLNYSCSVYITHKFINIETTSGRGMVAADPLFPSDYISIDVDEITLGKTILAALSNSRTLSLEECGDFFDLDKGKANYENWVERLIEKYKFNSRKALFKDMKNCSIMCTKGQITINPTRHEKLEAWGGKGIKDSDHVVLPADSPPAKIGEALRLAFSRCIG